MEGKSRFSWKARARSFVYAFRGIRALIACEHNARIHLVGAATALLLSAFLRISAVEWCVVLLCCGGVFAAEAFNSAIEALADKITVAHDPLIGKAKDMAAGAVLLFVIAALAAGCVIFLPKLYCLIN